MILTEEDRSAIEDGCEMMIGKPAFDAIEAAVLSKLAQGVVMPEPMFADVAVGKTEPVYTADQLRTCIAAARVKALDDAASVSEDMVTALCGLPDVDRLIALGDDIASNIRALKGGAA